MLILLCNVSITIVFPPLGFGLLGFDGNGERIVPEKMQKVVGEVWLQPALKKVWNKFLGLIKIVVDTHLGRLKG